jgi:tousled-like kinase
LRRQFKPRKKNEEPEVINGFTRNEIKMKLSKLNKKEEEVNKELINLRNKKFDLVIKEKKLLQEEKCIYAKIGEFNDFGAWPILNSQYQVLSLLGKGGFSEVYKVFDFKNFRYAACKLHSVNSKWDNETKQNYMKHTIREIKVFKQLDHRNIIE